MSSALSSKLRTRFCEYIEEGLSGRAAAAIGANTAKARFVRMAAVSDGRTQCLLPQLVVANKIIPK